MANMTLSREGAMELIGHEGIVSDPYLDSVDVWTIGVGHSKAAGPPDPKSVTTPLTLKQCFDLFTKDAAKYAKAVNTAVKVDVSQTEFDALVSFHYNTGGIATAALVKSLNKGDRKKAAEQFMSWKKPDEVVPRRKKEQILFAKGTYSNGGKALVYPVKNKKPQFHKGKLIDLTNEI